MSLLRNAHRPYCHLDNEEEKFMHRHYRKIRRKKNRLQRWLMFTVAVLTIILVSVIVAAINISLTNGSESLRSFMESVSGAQQSSAAFEDALVVRTNCGEYVGTIEDGAFVFKGIPYAKPPVGHLRWKKPVPLWADMNWCSEKPRQRAHKYSIPCFQLNPSTKKYSGKEDCLYLNVWTPRLDASAGLEVMVWIHGGFFQFGSGHDPGLCPSGRVSKDMNMVFVSFNFRLYALGFMALELLAANPEVDTSGNYGIWDQMVALEWVQKNIRAFGGDPEKVTVFGADSGAASILALMMSKPAKGFFQSAWLIGSTMTYNRTYEDLAQHNRAFFLSRSGCANETCLRKMTPRAVIQNYLWKDEPSFRIRDQNDLPIQGIYPEQLMVIDDDLLRAMPLETIREGLGYEDIPLLVGTAAQAINVWPGPEDLPTWQWSHLEKYVKTSLDSFGTSISARALQEYNSSEFNDFATPEEVYCTMVSDLRQTCPVHDLCQALSNSSQSHVYRYIVTAKPSHVVRLLDYPASYSFHSWEVIAFFDHMELYIDHPSKEDFLFRDHMQKVVGTFVRSAGRRTSNSKWKTYPETVAVISHNVTVASSYHSSKCQFWQSEGFVNYAWVS